MLKNKFLLTLFLICISVKLSFGYIKEITVVGSPFYAPFIFLDAENKPQGIFVDFWNLFGEKNNIKINFKLMPWDKAQQTVKENQNYVICGFFPSKERDKYFELSRPFLKISTNIFFHKDIYGIRDLSSLSGFSIGIVKGDYAYEYVKNLYPQYSIITYNTVNELIDSALKGDIKVFILDKPVGLFYLSKDKRGKNFKVSKNPIYSQDVVTGVKKGDIKLIEFINSGLKKITKAEIDGILKQWQGASFIDVKKIIISITSLTLFLIVVFIWNFFLQKKVKDKTKELLKLNEQFKTTLISIGDALITTDINGKITLMNPVAERLTGWPLKEALGKELTTVFNIVNGITREPAKNPVKKVFETGKVQGLANHTKLISKQGKEYHIADSAAPIVDENNIITGCVLIFRDVSQEYNAAERLKKQQIIIERACDIAKIAISEFDQNGNLIFANDIAYSIFELEKDKKITRDLLFEYIVDEDLKKVKEKLKELSNGNVISLSFRMIGFKTKNIKEIFCIGELDKNTKNAVLVGQDITYLKKLKEQLVQSEERYKVLFEQSPLGIFVFDREGTILDCNDVFAQAIGTDKKNLIGFNMKKQVLNKGVIRALEDSFKNEIGTFEGEYTSVLGNKTGYVRCIFKTIKNDQGDIIGGVGIVQDLTELERHRQELFKMEKLESIGTLAAGIAHDFNNMLAGIFGQINLAKNKLNMDHPAHSHLVKANKVIDRAKRITTQLLSLARGWEPVKEVIDLRELIKNIVDFDLSGSNIKAVYKFSDNVLPVLGDISQLERAFSNIIINAKQAMKDGGVLEISLCNQSILNKKEIPGLTPGEYVFIRIKDNGPGMDEEIIDRIFDPFFTTKEKGRGLGLTTSYSIVTKHGGTIKVKSKKGEGTTFYVYLPASKEKIETKTKQKELFFHEAKGGKILFLDDEEMLREIVHEVLTMNGFSVDVAATGEEALEKYIQAYNKNEPYALVIMDLTIPGGMGGLETSKKILEINNDAKLVITSGYSDDPVIANYANYGFLAALQKPFQLEKLLSLVNELI